MATTTANDASSRLPIRISKVAGRYLLFDVDDVMYIRRNHNMCPVFGGTTPQNPQQNLFTGLPCELMDEEAAVLVNKGLAYVADDAVAHALRLSGLTVTNAPTASANGQVAPDDPQLGKYLKGIQDVGRGAQLAVQEIQQQKYEHSMRKAQEGRAKGKKKKNKNNGKADETQPTEGKDDAASALSGGVDGQGTEDDDGVSLFDTPKSQPSPRNHATRPAADKGPTGPPYGTTPTTSENLFVPPASDSVIMSNGSRSGIQSFPKSVPMDNLPASYPLYAHLQSRGYYMMPGLRFGCDYNVYPGDPLRFHAHFQAVCYDWNDETIDLLDLGAGGRLGTRVKKGYLIGGAVSKDGDKTPSDEERDETDEETDDGEAKNDWEPPEVRTFSIEWAGM